MMKKALGIKHWAMAAALVFMARHTLGGIQQGGDFAAGVVEIEMAGGNTSDWWFTPKTAGAARQISITASDIVLTNYEDIITYNMELTPLAYTASYDVVVGDAPETVRYYSADGLFEVDETSGLCVSVGEGEGEIILKSDSLERRMKLTSAPTLPGQIGYSEHLAEHVYLDDTVKKQVNETFEALIAGHDGSESDLALYALQDHAATNYVRNTNCWAYSLDMTCASPWNSTGDPAAAGRTGLPSGQFRAATAITRRHVLSSNHYHLMQGWAGSDTNFEIRFVTQDNQVVIRHCVGYQSVTNKMKWPPDFISPDGNEWPVDYVVLRLDSPLPASITPAKRLPDDWESYMPYTQGFTNAFNAKIYNENFPLVMTDQQERATIGESFGYGLGNAITYQPQGGGYGYTDSTGELYFSRALFLPGWGAFFEQRDTYIPFYRDKINGDSSSPQLLFINGAPVLTGTLTYGGGGTAMWPVAMCSSNIQDIITHTFGDTNIWEMVDLTGFRKF